MTKLLAPQPLPSLEQLLHERISTFTASDKPKEIIDEHVEAMFKSVIENAFRKPSRRPSRPPCPATSARWSS